MILYGAPMPAPNPRRVRMFLAEKGIDLPETKVDMMKREHKSPEFRAKNSMGQIPTLELDDAISETVAGDGANPMDTSQAAMRLLVIKYQRRRFTAPPQVSTQPSSCA